MGSSTVVLAAPALGCDGRRKTVVPLSEYQSEIGFRWRVDDDNARRPIRERTEAVQAGERYWTD